MNNSRNYLVYLHLNPENHQVFYVGIGTEKRPYQTVSRNKIWKAYVQKHGTPRIEIFCDHLTKEEAFQMEVELIHVFGRRSFEERGQLVNIALGGSGIRGHVAWNKGKKMSEEMRMKRSEYMKQAEGHITEAGRKVLSQKMLGDSNPMSNPEIARRVAISQSKKVYQYSMDGVLIDIHYGTKSAAKKLSIDQRSILRAIKGEYRQYKGFVWTHEETHTHTKTHEKNRRRTLTV
jgi:hypothetical protein